VSASGLVRNTNEAHVLIVPALASEDLLPEADPLDEPQSLLGQVTLIPGKGSITVSVYQTARRECVDFLNYYLARRTSKGLWILSSRQGKDLRREANISSQFATKREQQCISSVTSQSRRSVSPEVRFTRSKCRLVRYS
jgi:hypothetical protein